MQKFSGVEKQAMMLSEDERAVLAARLRASLQKPHAGLEEVMAGDLHSTRELRAIDSQPRYTFKVDASYQLERKVTGIGIVIHASDNPRRTGKPIEQIAELYEGIPSSMSEKFAILRALELAHERGYTMISIRSDYNYLRRLLKKDQENNTGHDRDAAHGLILQYVMQLKEIRFPYHPRRKNQEAHKLARCAVRELDAKPCRVIFGPSFSGEYQP